MNASHVLREARGWLGVRWRHQGRDRSGVDCIGLVIEVAKAVHGSSFDVTGYERQASIETMLNQASKLLHRRNEVACMQPGDVLVMRFESQPHMAIVGDYVWGGLSIIHAYAGARKVVEQRLDQAWQSRIVAAFAWPASGLKEAH